MWGILGIREGIYRVLGMGNLEGGRVPLGGALPEGEWEKLKSLYEPIEKIENAL
jgi:2-keto-3-deoxy-L-rhamnonate aldolase